MEKKGIFPKRITLIMINKFSFVSLLVFLMNTLVIKAQYVEQMGVAYRYNGKNPRTPIGGVYVKTVSSPNGVVSDKNTGTFVLRLQGLKTGDRIGKAMVKIPGMMVFNQQAVDEWHVRKEPLILILCDANDFQKQKNALIEIGKRQAEKKYEKKLKELENQKKKMSISIEQYYLKLDSIGQERQNALKHMDEYADMFVRIDQSEIDTVAQRAIELFQEGKLEESIHLFESQNYLGKIDDALDVKSQAAALLQQTITADSLANKDIKEYITMIKSQVEVYKRKQDWRKAGELLKGLADIQNTPEAVMEYALYANNHNMPHDSKVYARKYIAIIASMPNDEQNKLKADIERVKKILEK